MSFISDPGALRWIDAMAIVLAQAYQLVRVRLADSGSSIWRALARRDHLRIEIELLRREMAVLRAQRAGLNPHKRPEYHPEQRFEILQVMRLRGWSLEQAARRFVLHPNTLRIWRQAVEGRCDPTALLGRPRWNRIDDAVKRAMHELRRLCPEPEFGTRTMARHLVRNAVKVSRSWVQKQLRHPSPEAPKPKRNTRRALVPPTGDKPHHLLAPTAVNHTWHLDLMTLRILWLRFTVAALMDGYSRRLLALRVCRNAASSRQAITLLQDATERYGTPRFLITDHGSQFRKVFQQAVEAAGTKLVKGRVRQPSFNGKVERLFKTLRIWLRLALLPTTTAGIQGHLDAFRGWYNQHRPHSVHGCLTPDEAWRGETLPEPMPIRSRDSHGVSIQVQRRSCRGDPGLPVVELRVAA